MIPRKQLFGNPEQSHVRVSPDGNWLAWLAPLRGVLNIWVGSVSGEAETRAVTRDVHRGIRSFEWAYTSRHILFPKDRDGDENWHIHSVDIEDAAAVDLTPIDGIAARIQTISPRFPDKVLIGINDRGERQFHDVYRIHIRSGERHQVLENPGIVGFMFDDDYRVRLGLNYRPDAGHAYLVPDAGGGWKEFMQVDPEDALSTHPVAFDETGDRVYMLDSRGRDKCALSTVDLKSGEAKVLALSEVADIDGALFHPQRKTVQAVTFTDARQEWLVIDSTIRDDIGYLDSLSGGDVRVTSRSYDDRYWTAAAIVDRGPVRFYVYDRSSREARFLFSSRSDLESLPLVAMHPERIQSRDGLGLVSYLSLPREADPEFSGRPSEPLPTVLLVHGGPWARDEWGFNAQHQWLADRGYAVLSVNFRGSTGFGKDFINRANREWGGAMHEDLLDALDWAVGEGIARRDRIAIMGGSYGGYATLVGLSFTPDVFCCGVDIVGPSNLLTLLENPPPYWMPLMPLMKVRAGDYTTAEGRAFLESRSPLFFVDRICRPLLIGQGKHDPRVPQAESDQIVEAMKERGIPVSYMLFTEEGHGFARPENRQAFFAVTEAFLARHLGGRFEPVGDAFRDAVFSFPAGQDGVPGLSEALAEGAS